MRHVESCRVQVPHSKNLRGAHDRLSYCNCKYRCCDQSDLVGLPGSTSRRGRPSRWGRARQASDASAAWSRERRGVMRARGIEGIGATPLHRSAVSRPGLHPGEVIAQFGMAGVPEPGECGKFQREHHLDVRRADLGAKGSYYRVMVGPFGSMEKAAGMCGTLKAAGCKCLVQRI